MIQAHLERRKPIDEGRTRARRKLHLAASGARSSGVKFNVLVHDLSTTGILLQTSAPLALGESIEVVLPHAGSTAANVVWESHDYFGCRFENQLSHGALSAAELKSAHVCGFAYPERGARDSRNAGAEETLGARLRRLRRECKLSQVGLSRMLGVSKPTVWKWERDENRPRQESLDALARIFCISERELVFGNGETYDRSGNRVPQSQDSAAMLTGFVSDCKSRIADLAGVSSDHVSISIQF